MTCFDKVRQILKEMTRSCPRHNEEIDHCLAEGKSDIDAISEIEKGKVKKCVKKDYRSINTLKLLEEEDWRHYENFLEVLMNKFQVAELMAKGIRDLSGSNRMKDEDIWLMAKQVSQNFFWQIDI